MGVPQVRCLVYDGTSIIWAKWGCGLYDLWGIRDGILGFYDIYVHIYIYIHTHTYLYRGYPGHFIIGDLCGYCIAVKKWGVSMVSKHLGEWDATNMGKLSPSEGDVTKHTPRISWEYHENIMGISWDIHGKKLGLEKNVIFITLKWLASHQCRMALSDIIGMQPTWLTRNFQMRWTYTTVQDGPEKILLGIVGITFIDIPWYNWTWSWS